MILFVLIFLRYPRWALVGIIIAKPVIDLTWNFFVAPNINFLKIYSSVFVIIGILFIIIHHLKSIQHTINWLWLFFLLLNFISIFIITNSTTWIDKIDYFLRISSGLVVYILFTQLFSFKKDRSAVLLIFIGAGVCSMLIWLIPALIGRPLFSNDPLKRIIGPYHDFWNFMFYGTQVVFSCLALLAVVSKNALRSTSNTIIRTISYLKRKNILSVILWFLIIVGIFMVYKCYTKAGWVTLGVCLFIWFLLRKRYIVAVLIPVLIILFISITPFSNEFHRTFSNEIGYYINGAEIKEEVFRGRLSRWDQGMVAFKEAPVVNKLFGIEKSEVNPENDYLRVLWDNGIIGFMIFLALLGVTGYLLIRKYAKNKDPVGLLGIIVWVMYLLYSIGSYPMLYPAFQWFMWGIIGFVLSERKPIAIKNPVEKLRSA
ncbi:MAG: O-antigen ligase family protein [bacterium]